MKIQLKESQIKNLIKGYKTTLLEQESLQPGTNVRSWEVNFSALWGPGKWKLTQSHLNNMKPELNKIVTYLRKNPNTKLNIQIVSSESRVPNYDREQSGDVKVKEGYLSQKRGAEMAQKLDLFFKELKLENSVEIPKAETRVGGPAWDGKNAKDEKYTDHQYVKLVIKGTYSIECLVGMNIVISTRGNDDGHTCDEAIFDFLVNGISLGVVNLNNGDKDSQTGEDQRDIMGERIKREIVRRNTGFIRRSYSDPLSNEIYKDYRIKRQKGEVVRLSEYEWNGKTIEDWATDVGYGTTYPLTQRSQVVSILNRYWVKYKPNEIKGYIDLTNGETKIPEEVNNTQYLRFHKGKTINELFNEPKELFDRVKNISGRESDGKKGGARSQTFVLDTNKSMEIVNQSKTKDKLILSIKPLVDMKGPYRLFFNKGSHSSVPRIRITGKNGDERYNKQPNVNITRGSTAEKEILKTDICGNEITQK